MTAPDRQRIRESFEAIRPMSAPVALLFYGRLFALAPAARRLFHNDMRLQGQKLMDMLAAIVAAADDLEAIRPRLEDLGRRHAGYGVQPEQYQILTEALMWAFAQALGPDFDDPTRTAWTRLLDHVNTVMLDAAAAKTAP